MQTRTIDALQCSNWDRELFEELKQGQVNAIHVTCAMWESARETLSQISLWQRRFREFDDLIAPITQPADFDTAYEAGKIGIILGFQNSSPIEDDLGLVEIFSQLGVRVMQLTYNNQSLLGTGCYERNDGGLTRFGREVIREMNRVGMVVDLSHVGEQTTIDAIEFSDRPVAITHSNPKFLADIPRNKSVRVLDAVIAHDAMFGCSLYPHLIGGRNITRQAYIEAIARLAEIIGVERIGIGSDAVRKCTPEYLQWMRMGRWTHTVDYGAGNAAVPGWPKWQDWFQTPADFPGFRQALIDFGFAPQEANQIMGENWYKYFQEAFVPQP